MVFNLTQISDRFLNTQDEQNSLSLAILKESNLAFVPSHIFEQITTSFFGLFIFLILLTFLFQMSRRVFDLKNLFEKKIISFL